jgi:toxin-antitoxin system PIN domain toxin
MSCVSLLDVNVLIALFDPDHIHHDIAHDWFRDDKADGWATCPITESGFVRILANPGYPFPKIDATVPALIQRLRHFCGDKHHHFWPENISLANEQLFDPAIIGGHRKLTDVYLLGLATEHDGRFVTFDRGIPLQAVKRATPANLAVIEPADN